MVRLLLLLVFLCLPGLAAAQERHCRAVVNGTETVVSYWPGALGPTSRGERMLGWPSAAWNRAWGTPPACSSQALISVLGSNLPLEDIDGFCLTEIDGLNGWLLVPGERNFRGRCRKTACERVNATAADVAQATDEMADYILNPSPQTGVRGLLHASGASILTGGGGGIIGALMADAGTAVATALSAPGVATAAAVSVVAFGGAVYVCRD